MKKCVRFAAFGEVSTASIIKDKFSGESRGFGFVERPNKLRAFEMELFIAPPKRIPLFRRLY